MAAYVVVRLDNVSIGLLASAVERVVQAVEVTPLPQAPGVALGVIDVHGSIIPVVNFRGRFGLPHRDIALSDQLILARTPERSLAFVADAVEGVIEHPESDITDLSTVVSGLHQIIGMAKSQGDIVFIHDLERFLTINEAKSLDIAIAGLGQKQELSGIDAS